MATKRLEYIDAARGLTMFLVVAQHITTYWGSLEAYEFSVLDQILRTFRMPLFFFISGFVAYKSSEFWNYDFLKRRLLTKAQVQLIPAIVFSALFALCFGGAPLGFLRDGFGFFWFTPVLFGMFCIYFPCCYLLRKSPKALDWTLLAIAAIAAILSFAILGHLIDFNPTLDKFQIGQILYYFEFFVLGHLVRKHEQRAFSILSNDWLNFAAIIVFVASMLLVLPGSGLSLNVPPLVSRIIRSGIVRYAGLFIVFAFFVRQREYFAQNGRASRTMQYVGRHTLDIYMLHHFFLPMNIKAIHTFVIAASLNPIAQLLVEGSFASIVVCLCLLISNILRNSNFLAHYLFGAKREKATKR